MIAAAIAFVLLIVANHADYLLQAHEWKWKTWWVLDSAGLKPPLLLAWLPIDSWHRVFSLKTFCMLAAPAIMVWYHATPWPGMFWQAASIAAAYATARGVGFSIPRKLYKGDING